MFLEPSEFKTVIANAPLISIDLIVERGDKSILLGRRINRPAKGNWFVPGGRILKNESLAKAFERITLCELGVSLKFEDAILLAPYYHFYEDCVFGEGVSTHYVALAYRIKVEQLNKLPHDQHENYKWMKINELLSSTEVHENTKEYFKE